MAIIELGENIPRRPHGLWSKLCRAVYQASGWSVVGECPNVKKAVIIAAPHTSNWDFVFGMLAVFSMRFKLHWMGKHTIFKKPFGKMFESWGGIPIYRDSKLNTVEQIIERFKYSEQLFVALAPEGTRSKVDQWKSGFYHIAVGAGVPIVMVYIDYIRKHIGFGPLFEPSGNYDEDIVKLQAFYKPIMGKRPELS